MPTQEEKIWGAVSHISYLAGLPVIVPLIIFLWKREQSAFVASQAKQAVGLHIATIIACAIALGFSFATFGLGLALAVPSLMVLSVIAFILSVVAVIKVSQGESYHYPLFGGWVDRL